jgi:disulfide bond formation protein DsbB
VTTETASLFLALVAVVAEAAVATAVVLWIGGRFSNGVARVRATAAASVAPQAVGLALAVAAVATAGSLYFSEVAHFPPCRLCWYQRACMYPLVPLLGWTAWRRDLRLRPVALALAGVGALVAAYHVLIERYPTLESGSCDPANPCTLIWVRRLGYLTIPTMALSAFLLILTLLLVAHRDDGS